jgi:integrase
MNPSAQALSLAVSEEDALQRAAKSLNRRLRRRGRVGLTLLPCPPLAGIPGRPFQICLGDRRLTLPLSATQVRTYLDGADKALDLREDVAVHRPTRQPAPAASRAALTVAEARELTAALRAIDALNARLQLSPAELLAVVPISRPVTFVAGRPYGFESGGRRLTIPLSATDVYLYLEGMAAALDLQDDALAGRRRRRAPAAATQPKPEGSVNVGADRGRTRRPEPTQRRPRSAGAPAPLDAEVSPATRRAYVGDLRYFWAWAAVELGLAESYPVSAETVERFVTQHLNGLPTATDRALVERGFKAALGPHRPATVERRLASLSAAHQAQGAPNPCAAPGLRHLLLDARQAARVARVAGLARPVAATYEALETLLGSCGDDPAGLRDRALLLLAWASGGVSRGRLAKARVQDLSPIEGGYLFRSGARTGAGIGPAIPILGRAAEALSAWLAVVGTASGPLFRPVDRFGRLGTGPLSAYGMVLLVKRRAASSGLDPMHLGGRSLRSGFGSRPVPRLR